MKQTSPTAQWRTPALLLLVFFGPFLIACLLYFYHGGALLTQHTNRGQLLSPPLSLQHLKLQTLQQQPFAQKQLRGRWLILYINGHCDHYCKRYIYLMRQLHTALGKNRPRVQRLFISLHPLSANMQQILKQHYPKLLTACMSTKHLNHWVHHQKYLQHIAQQGQFFIADPHGNVILAYPGKMEPQDIWLDLRKLLKLSQIG